MSHLTRMKTSMMVKEYIVAALKDMGYEYQEGALRVRDYLGRRARVAMRINTGTKGYDIGIAKRKEGFEVVADWWGIKGIEQETFMRTLKRRYAYHATRGELEKRGFAVVNEEMGEEGKLHLTLRRAV